MCFYYSITKKSINTLVKGKIIKEGQLSLFDEHYIVNGFEHPRMPVITDDNPQEIQYFQWGFMPTRVNSMEEAIGFLNRYNTLNAKAEDIANSKLYRGSFLNRRCLVLCSGFFEWRQVKKEKIPYFITLQDDQMFVFAGIWNVTTDNNGNTVNSYSILTIEANEIMAQIHNTKKRMPLILSPEDANQWLNAALSAEEVSNLIKPLSSDQFKAHTIRKFMPANTRNINSSEIIAYYHYPHVKDIMGNLNLLL